MIFYTNYIEIQILFVYLQGVNPFKVTIGTPENKSKRTSFQQLSFEIIKQLQTVLELSKNKTKEMAATLHKGAGSKLSIEPNIFGCLSELEDYISSYLKCSKVQIC